MKARAGGHVLVKTGMQGWNGDLCLNSHYEGLCDQLNPIGFLCQVQKILRGLICRQMKGDTGVKQYVVP